MANNAVNSMPNSLIVIPTYNEKDNIEALINEIDKVNKGKFDILFVDDTSPDGTGELIKNISLKRPNIFLIQRRGKMGLGSAYLEGFQYGIKKMYRYIFEMDADLSHDPKYLEPMTKVLNNFDIVMGSRFRGKLQNINSTPFRILTSFMAAIYMRLLLGLQCSDPMGGFTGYRREALEGLDYPNFFTKGYAFQAEVKYRCKISGFKMAEIPIVFKNRDTGDSKISTKDVMEAIMLPWKTWFLCLGKHK